MKLLILILLFATAVYAQESRPRYVKVDESKKVVKTVSSRVVGARNFSATAYCLTGKMANGQKVHSGAIAADPSVLKIGTKVRIHGHGIFVVKDTGGAIRGYKIDIWNPSCSQARIFGRRTVQLTIVN